MTVLDANVLVRGALGVRVRSLLARYYQQVDFFAPTVAFEDARRRLPVILQRRKAALEAVMSSLSHVEALVQPVGITVYGAFESEARRRIERRDVDDWPILPTALALNSPIWTEDADFFGTGVATWTTDRVEIFLAAFESKGRPCQ